MPKTKKTIEEKPDKITEISEKIEVKAIEINNDLKDDLEETTEKTVEKVKEKIKETTIEGKEKNRKDEVEKAKKSTTKQEGDVTDKKAKLAKLLEKAKQLEAKIEDVKPAEIEEIKKKVKEELEEKKDTLVPMEDYLKASIHLGTRVITPDMRQYVYRRRADGLAVFNTALLDDKIREGADFLSEFSPEDVIVICKREAGWKAVNKFSEVTGIRAFTKKYPAGILTNSDLANFFETELVFISDPWLDKNALQDANRIGIPVLSICDTNNFTKGITKVIPGNNKSAKSLGIILYLLTKLYTEKRKMSKKIPPIQEFIDQWDELVPPK